MIFYYQNKYRTLCPLSELDATAFLIHINVDQQEIDI